jgi:hypothetical protein
MKAAFYFRRSKPGGAFWFCPVCRKEQDHDRSAGAYVQVANEVQAIVCVGECESKVKQTLAEAFPGAFPDVDNRGFILGE